MSFAGTTWLQGIALGQLAPFINTNGVTLTVPDNIFSKFVELLWAMSPKYRRILSLAEYNQYVKPYFRDLTLGDLMASIDRLDGQSASVARSLGESGGWFQKAGDFYNRHKGKILAGAGTLAGLGALNYAMDDYLAGDNTRAIPFDDYGHDVVYRRGPPSARARGDGAAGGQYPVVQESNNARYIDLNNPGSGSASAGYRRQRGQ
jgi:hypothetical protein